MGFCGGIILRQDNLLALPSNKTSAIDLYDLKTLQKVRSLFDSSSKLGMTMSIKSIADSSQFFVGYEDGSIGLWDSKHSEILDRTKFFEECVMCQDYSSGANLGVCGSPSNMLSTWSRTENKIMKGSSLEIKNPGFNDIRIRGDHKIFATAGWDHTVRIFGVKKLRPLAVLTYHKESVQCLDFSRDNTLACGSKDQHISLWKIYWSECNRCSTVDPKINTIVKGIYTEVKATFSECASTRYNPWIFTGKFSHRCNMQLNSLYMDN